MNYTVLPLKRTPSFSRAFIQLPELSLPHTHTHARSHTKIHPYADAPKRAHTCGQVKLPYRNTRTSLDEKPLYLTFHLMMSNSRPKLDL